MAERVVIGDATLYHGDCREVLKTLPECSVDSVVTDPPYELGFMGKHWDSTGVANDPAVWAECLRVLKPGGYLLAFSGTRTQHRTVCAIEDAGFEIRDQIGWAYGSGFPKSHNGEWGGTALKPAWEPICMARKPLIGTVAANVLAHGTGALNIDGCRVASGDAPFSYPNGPGGCKSGEFHYQDRATTPAEGSPLGRWPANLIHDGSDEVVALFPQTASGSANVRRESGADRNGNTSATYGAESRPAGSPMVSYGDAGSAARFFYCAKADRADRNDGCYDVAPQQQDAGRKAGNPGGDNRRNRGVHARQNHHPTVKPTDLMRYLCRLVTPPGGTVLDPFMGSGSTMKAAELEGFSAIGIEMSAEYIEIARRRIASDAPLFAQEAMRAEPEAPTPPVQDSLL
jgi:DNA modification methylase